MTKTLNIIMEYKDTTESRKLILNSPEHMRLFLIYENSPDDYDGDIPALLTVVPTNASLKVFKNNNDILSLHWRKGDIREVVAVVLRADPNCEETLDYWPNLHSYAKQWQSERKSIIKSLLPPKSRGDSQSRSHGDVNANSGSTTSRLARERRNKQDSNRNTSARNNNQSRQESRNTPVDRNKPRRDVHRYPPYVDDIAWSDHYPPYQRVHPYPHHYPYPVPSHVPRDHYPPSNMSRMYGPPPPAPTSAGPMPYPPSGPGVHPYYRDHGDDYSPLPDVPLPEYPYHPPPPSRPGLSQRPYESERQMKADHPPYDYPMIRRPSHHAYPTAYDDVPPLFPSSQPPSYPPAHDGFDVPYSRSYPRAKYHSSLHCLEPPYDSVPHAKTRDIHSAPQFDRRLGKVPHSDFPVSGSELFPDRLPMGPRSDSYHPLVTGSSITTNRNPVAGSDHVANSFNDRKHERDMKPSLDTSIVGDPTAGHSSFAS